MRSFLIFLLKWAEVLQGTVSASGSFNCCWPVTFQRHSSGEEFVEVEEHEKIPQSSAKGQEECGAMTFAGRLVWVQIQLFILSAYFLYLSSYVFAQQKIKSVRSRIPPENCCVGMYFPLKSKRNQSQDRRLDVRLGWIWWLGNYSNSC